MNTGTIIILFKLSVLLNITFLKKIFPPFMNYYFLKVELRIQSLGFNIVLTITACLESKLHLIKHYIDIES